MLSFEGAAWLRQRVVLSALSGQPIRISNIRSLEDDPGLIECEASFLKLMDKLTNGSRIEIGYTGTSFVFRPGALVGGKIEHDCGTHRAIGYYLEAVIWLAPFCKKPIQLTLTGITNDDTDLGVDTLRTVTLPQLAKFGVESDVELKIQRRGAPPEGGGQVFFRCPAVRALKAVDATDEGRIKRIRGIAYATRVSPQTANRMVDSARALLNRFIPDVFIYTDHYKGTESGKSPGFGLSLVAESTSGVLVHTELYAKAGDTPEDLGRQASKQLYLEISRGGCCDSVHQGLNVLFMALGPEDVSKLRIGKLTKPTIQLLRDLQTFFGITFKITPDAANKTVLMTCVGVGYLNLNKKVT